MRIKLPNRFFYSRKLACLEGKLLILLLFAAGCARLEPALKKGIPVSAPRGLEVHAQYAVSSAPRIGYNTFEIYIANHTKDTIVFTDAELNGKPLPKVQSKEIAKLLTVKLGEGDEIQLTEPGFSDDSPVTWWQYYPRNELKPGETIEFQVNFKAMPTGRQSLRLLTSSLTPNSEPRTLNSREDIFITVPRFHQPDKRLTSITYSLDGKRMFVQYASRKVALKKLFVNGNNIRKFKILQSVAGDTPDMAAFDAPIELKNGDVLHVRSEFEDGSRRDALVRVLLGIALDGGFSGKDNEQAIRKEYGLDDYSVVEMLPFDVACSDSRANKKGMSAPFLSAERLKSYESQVETVARHSVTRPSIENSLLAVNYCAAFYPELGNIYGQITDAVYAKPYQLSWGKRPERFIEAEERRAVEEAQSAQPRPWLWIPDRFNRSGRYMASGELELLAWLTLELGSKGIRYHYWNKPVAEIAAEHPWLLSGLAKLNKDIASKKEILSPLVPAGEMTLDKEKIKMCESWAGDRGILLMVRNLNYRTAPSAAAEKKEPRFEVTAKEKVSLSVSLPVWFKGKNAVDLLSGKSLSAERQKDVMLIKLNRLEAFQLIWLGVE